MRSLINSKLTTAELRSSSHELIDLSIDHENEDIWVNRRDHYQVFFLYTAVLRKSYFQIQNGAGDQALINGSFARRQREGVSELHLCV